MHRCVVTSEASTGQGLGPAPFAFCVMGGIDRGAMKDFVRSALQWLAESRLARRVADALFRTKARQRLVELDHQDLARCQNRTLLGLVHKAHTTRFGREHDFRRIRNAGDFRRLVPLRTPAELWRDYWQPAFPNLAGATWPAPLPYLAISSVPHHGPFPYIPVSPDLWAAQQTTALTALAFVMHARPRARLCSGRLFLLGSGSLLTPLGSQGQPESFEAVAVREMPPVIRPYAFAPPGMVSQSNGSSDERFLADLAERSIAMPVTCIAGTTRRLLRFFDHARRITGRDHLLEVWPNLAAVLFARGSANTDRARLVEDIGSKAIVTLEMFLRPEGAIAIEDPRHGGLRLLPDHGVYFEFVPIDQVDKPRAPRYSAAEVKVGVPYALAVSSSAGVWACLVGSMVRFERLNPPLLRLLDMPALLERPAPVKASPAAKPFPAQPPHPRMYGSGATPLRRPFRSASSARGDRE